MREIDKDPIPITLVLLNWKRAHNLNQIFEHLAQFKVINEYIISFLLQGIYLKLFDLAYIWNNDNEKFVTELSLFPKGVPPGVSVRIINSPQNLHDYAKYLSCSMATNDYCYFQVHFFFIMIKFVSYFTNTYFRMMTG